MSRKYSAFSYKPGNSFVHKLPAQIKILILPILSIILFQADINFAVYMAFLQSIISFYVKFSLKEQFQDLKPVVFYAFVLYFISFLGHFLSNAPSFSYDGDFFYSLKEVATNGVLASFENKESLKMLLKLLVVIQGASIFYRTSTTLEIREGIGKIEIYMRKLLFMPQKKEITNLISLFFTFIPLVHRVWSQLSAAWTIRGGSSSIKKYFILIPIWFSISMKKAYDRAKGEEGRRR